MLAIFDLAVDQELISLLTQLRPEARPESILWWPPSWGWFALLLAALLVLVAAASALRWRQRRLRDNYFIDQALAQLRLVSSKRLEPRAQLQAINAILKQAALSAYPEADSANLVGLEWLSFLDSKWSQSSFQEHDQLLQQRYQRALGIDEQMLRSFAAQSRLWLIAQRSNKLRR